MVLADSSQGVAACAADPGQLVRFAVTQGLTTQAHQQGFPDVTQVNPWPQESLTAPRITGAPPRRSLPEVRSVIKGHGQTVFSAVTPRVSPDWIRRPAGTRRPIRPLVPGNGLAIRPALGPGIVMTAELAGVPRAPVAVPIHHRFTVGPRPGAVSHA